MVLTLVWNSGAALQGPQFNPDFNFLNSHVLDFPVGSPGSSTCPKTYR